MKYSRRQLFFIETFYIIISLLILFAYCIYYVYIYSLVYINGNNGRIEKA